MSCENILQAEAFLDDDYHLKLYAEDLWKLEKDGYLPNLTTAIHYHFYTIQASGLYGHRSVVLSTNYHHFVTLELGFWYENGKNYVLPVTRALNNVHRSKLHYCGTIYTTGEQLINQALVSMKAFGFYSQACNNCHHLCDTFLVAIGLEDSIDPFEFCSLRKDLVKKQLSELYAVYSSRYTLSRLRNL